MQHVIIIGTGIGGLSAAYRLRERAQAQGRQLSITLLEASSQPGGVIASSQQAGFTLEHGPDSIIRTKPAGMQLIKDLELDDQIQGTNPDLSGSLIVKGNTLLPIPKGLYLLAPGRLWPFALSPLVSWPGKLRMLLDLCLPRRAVDAEEESLAAFVRRRLGREALERIAQPLVGGIYTADPELLSLSHCMPQFPEMEREHRSLLLGMRRRTKAMAKQEGTVSGARYGLFISLQGGLQCLVDRLQERLTDCTIHCDSPVQELRRQEHGWTVSCQGKEHRADAVVLAMQAGPAAQLCKPVDDALATELGAIPYASVATINLGFKRADLAKLPEAAGFVVPAVEQRNLVACTFASTKYLNRCPDDGVLLRAFVGGALQAEQLEVDDDTMIERVLTDLKRWLPITGAPHLRTVHRWPNAMAQPVVGHAQRLARIRERERALPGLALVGNGYEGVGIPDIIDQANQASQRLMPE